MLNYTIKNKDMTAVIKADGAELISLKKGEREYMWCGDPAFWGRVSPVLFPLVGSLKGKKYVHDGITYSMGQHGFARDTEFEPVSIKENAASFRLVSNEKTLNIFPFEFSLLITYELSADGITVTWEVRDISEKDDLYFSIGAHPAFLCGQDGFSFMIHGADMLTYEKLNSDGTLNREAYEMQLEEGILPINRELFAEDALIFENSGVKKIGLTDEEGNEYLSVEFDAPLFGLWSPAGKNAPFVCIEPWYGRCDAEDFEGEWADREWANHIRPGECFTASYRILV